MRSHNTMVHRAFLMLLGRALLVFVDGSLVTHAVERDVVLMAPLTTRVLLFTELTGEDAWVSATVNVPPDAPTDLGIGLCAMDRHGRWFEQPRSGVLTPGLHHLRWLIDASARFREEGGHGVWNAALLTSVRSVGLYFWSATANHARLVISDIAIEGRSRDPRKSATAMSDRHQLVDVEVHLPPHVQGPDTGDAHTGERWEVTLRPDPFPTNPYDTEAFRLEAVITDPEGREQTIPGFCREPQLLVERGDREMAVPSGAMQIVVRFRAQQPGRHRVRIVARWSDNAVLDANLPDVVVTGAPWNEYAHIDRVDSRFFSVAARWWWPIGLNMHSPFDLLSQEVMGTRLTPDKGVATYAAYFKRFAAHGGTAVEIWLAPWCLGLEWNADWPGYQGTGRYNQENAERLDQILDSAWQSGIRVNLVIVNHGQASVRVDSEWNDHPWNILNGGLLSNPYQLFTDPRAQQGQANLRRYLVARYADHPAVLAWKLWTEIDLTVAGNPNWATPSPRLKRMLGTQTANDRIDSRDDPPPGLDERLAALARWHADATAQMHRLDVYGHPITTHWSSTFEKVHPQVAALPGVDLLCIDAYRMGDTHITPDREVDVSTAKLLWASVDDPTHGLSRFAKGVLVTEYGGSSQGANDAVMRADHAAGAWVALVGGHAGSPHLWWHEWVDQGEQWQPYQAISAFIVGEDLRGGHSHDCPMSGDHSDLAGRAWIQPGRILAYVIDLDWNRRGVSPIKHKAAQMTIPDLPAGAWHRQWWDADGGVPLEPTLDAFHPGGGLLLTVPGFTRHVALKMWAVH